jgi:hypothetical protein
MLRTRNRRYTSGEAVEGFPDSAFRFPTVIAEHDDRLLVVNSPLSAEGGQGGVTVHCRRHPDTAFGDNQE